MAQDRYHRIDDARVLRAVAHPVRNRILAELSATGPMRAADISEQIGVPANQASFHLRQLAKYQLVEEAPELARDGRDRVWRVTSPSGWTVNLDELEQEPGGSSAVAVFRQHASAQAHQLVETAYGAHESEGIHRMITDVALRLTQEEGHELGDALNDLVEEWRERTAGRDSDRSTYRLLMVLQPYDNPEGRD